MDSIRIYVATTAGPSEVLDLTEEDPEVHSVICLGGSELDLPVSPAYHRFVREPTGVIERHFRHAAYRMDVSERIEAGGSWKLAVLAAHALACANRLAKRAQPGPAPMAWLTGDVMRDLSVAPVGHVPEKLALSRELFARQRAADRSIAVFMPRADLDALDSGDLDAAGLRPEEVTGVEHANDVMKALALAPLATAQTRGRDEPDEPLQDRFGAPLDFGPVLVEKARDFEGRAWLLDEIAAWRTGAAGERALLVLGEPGTGKSALAARLIGADTTGRPGEASGVAAYHLCQATTPATTDPGLFVRSLAAMIARARPEFADAVTNAGGAPFLTLEACRNDPQSALDLGLLPALGRLAQQAAPLAIVVDGLDESLGAGASLSIADLLGPRMERLPAGWRLVLTARPDPRLTRLLGHVRSFRIEADDTRNLDDLAAYVRRRLAQTRSGDEAEALATNICRASDGNFLYARQVLDGLARGLSPAGATGDLPRGLEGLYEGFFSRLWPGGAGFDPAAQVLAVLLSAHEPLTASQIFRVFALSNQAPPVAALEALGPFLRSQGQTLSLFHTSLSDWLTATDRASGRFWVDRAHGGRMLLAYCRQWREIDDSYALRHVAAHLRQAGELGELKQLLAADEYTRLKSERLGGALDLQDDYRELAAGLIAERRDGELAAIAMAETAQPGAAVVSAVLASDLDANRAQTIVELLFRAKTSSGGARDLKTLNGRRAALWLAQRLGAAALLERAASDRSPAVRAAAVPFIYRLWRDSPDRGWALLETLGARVFSSSGLPRARLLEVVGGVSLAMVARHLDDRPVMARLRNMWRGWARKARERPLTRLIGRRWTMALIVPSLRLLLRQQPDYQPLNLKEMETATGLAAAHRQARLAVIDCLEHPERGPGIIVEVLADRARPFDVILMLAAERALIVQGKDDPAAVMSVLAALHETGAAWFRQSVLYSGFHVLRQAERDAEAWLPVYRKMSRQTIGEGRALFATKNGTYRLVPHMAWTEVLRGDNEDGDETGGLKGLMSVARETGDTAFCERIVGAAEILSLGYGRHERALDVLRPAIATGDPKLAQAVVTALANIRFHAETTVDGFLRSVDDAHLSERVQAAAPTVKASDFPTWIDDLVVRLLIDQPGFRQDVVFAFRRASDATSLRQLLEQIVPWVVDLVSD